MSLGSFRRRLRSRHLAWLVALALWLPAAQWLAATHALLHLHASVASDVDPPAHLPAACDTCVVAAAIGGAAPLSEVDPGLAPPPPQARPLASLVSAPTHAPATAYRSRAPPLPHA